MAHAKAEDLADLEALLEGIRKFDGLKEKSRGCFYKKGKGVLHFHIKQGRRYAHVWDGKTWHEVDLPQSISKAAQKRSLVQIQNLIPTD